MEAFGRNNVTNIKNISIRNFPTGHDFAACLAQPLAHKIRRNKKTTNAEASVR
jgi:hypothetical protein